MRLALCLSSAGMVDSMNIKKMLSKGAGLLVVCAVFALFVFVISQKTEGLVYVYQDNETVKIEVDNVRFHPLHMESLNTSFGDDVWAEYVGQNTIIYINKEFYYAQGGDAIARYIEGVAGEYIRLQRKSLPPLHASLPMPDDCKRNLATDQIEAIYWNGADVHVSAYDEICTGEY